MQLLGVLIGIGVVALGFMSRGETQLSYFDPHAAVIILLGSFGAVLLGSRPRDFARTISILKQLLPGLGDYAKTTSSIESERKAIEELWLKGSKAEAVAIGDNSRLASSKEMVQQVLARRSRSYTENRFTAMVHEVIDDLDAGVNNWELLAKLGPSFGIVGTITGMINLFKSFGDGNGSLVNSMSLALLATLYGIAFGAAIASPIATFSSRLLGDRVNTLKRCEKTTRQLIAIQDGSHD